MEKLTAKLSESILDKFSMDFLRNQVLKNAYGNDDTVIAALDPRILLAWYLFFGLVPWFVNDIPFLLGCFLLVMATTLLAPVLTGRAVDLIVGPGQVDFAGIAKLAVAIAATIAIDISRADDILAIPLLDIILHIAR